ncbi:hypothetical protein F0562_029335 [Nyssa sinensis]|uniref:PWWP domain-containing protein n=1 Tax=Nyssa sinensis TaxID=561372 RepID=A0A5J5B4W0_9ASTE|nr:hypothetical protein F0562_029335 [Nyssa sinensis]
MISVMSNNDFELNRKPDAIEDEPQSEPRVSVDNIVHNISDKVTTGGSDGRTCVDMFGFAEIKVSQGDDVDSFDKLTHGCGDKGLCLDTIGHEEIRVSMELKNQAQERVVVDRISVGDVDVDVKNVRSDEIRVSEIDFRGAGHLGSRVGGEGSNFAEKGLVEVIPRVSDDKFDFWNGGVEHRRSRPGKGHVEVGKPGVSQYDSMISMFDEFAANGRGKALGAGLPHSPLGYGYEIGDMVWGKVKSHPWWPGHIYNEAFASPSVRRTKREGHVLVAFFGDSSYGWFELAELLPFDPNFAEKSQQTNSRNFMKAVEEAVDEASRRRGLALACRCRNPYNFRPTSVEGYFFVDVSDYELSGVYSVSQIRKARDNFRPREILNFINQLALMPTIDEHPSIDFIKNKATVSAYRKAVFEEFDETYAQAFGMQPVRPSREPTGAVAQLVKEPSRAPLSGPMVFAEALGKGKNSTKPNKAKDKTKKDRYLLKRRDELDESEMHQLSLGQASSSTQPAYVEGSLALAAGDYLLQRRDPVGSAKPQIPAKHEWTGTTSRNGASVLSRDVASKVVTPEVSPAVVNFSITGSQVNASNVEASESFAANMGQTPANSISLLEVKSPLDKVGGTLLDTKEAPGSEAAGSPASVHVSTFSGKGVFPGVLDNVPCTFEPEGEATIDLKHDSQGATKAKLVEYSSLLATTEELRGREQILDGCKGAKKAKVLKRPAGELTAEKSAPGEKKKKRKKELGMEMSFDHMQKRTATGKSGALVGKVAGKPVQVAWAPREVFKVDHQKKDDGACSSLLPDSVGTQPVVGIGNIELELPQLLSDLQALALNPFHGMQRNSPAIIHHVFLRFRSLVYQKSLALSQASETESTEVHATKCTAGAAFSDIPQGENIRNLPAPKPAKPPVRPDDPTKGGRKRGPSDRQEEIATKRLKKINDLKTLTAERKVAQKTPEALRGDGKETVVPPPPKPVKADPTKRMELPPAKTPDPTMLVMKFPPQTNLPSGSELKARLARFGQLDHSGTRIFWKTSTCRVVFLYKLDAEAAYRYLMGNNSLFGNVTVRCHIREVGVAAPESESGKVRTEDTPVETPQLRDSAVEQRLPAVPAHQPIQQPAVQLKSCLKKSSGDEPGLVTGGNGGVRGTTRVKFMLGGEDSRGEQLMIGNKNHLNHSASFADGGASSSSHAMEFNSKNFQKVIPPLPSPILPLPSTQFPKAPSNLHYTEIAPPRNMHNFNPPAAPAPALPSTNNIDIAQQMLSLLTRCNDVVTNVKSFLGYVPYHPL